MMRFKRRVFRFVIRWRQFKKSLSKPKPEIDTVQEWTIKLFFVLLKNKNAILNYSAKSATRVIDSEIAWITMTGNVNDYTLSIIENFSSDKPIIQQVQIPMEHAQDMIEEFDVELDKRIKAKEMSKKRAIAKDLEKLIEKSEESNHHE